MNQTIINNNEGKKIKIADVLLKKKFFFYLANEMY